MRRPLTTALVGLLALLPVVVQAQVTLHYTFEDGQRQGTPTQMKVPVKMLEEGGNTFMRITGSAGDCQSIPATMCPRKNRSSVRFTSNYTVMPLISAGKIRYTYTVKMRFHDDTGTDGTVFTLYQSGQRLGGYGTDDGVGPVVIMLRKDGRTYGRAHTDNGKSHSLEFDFGKVRSGEWHEYKVVGVWSHDPKVSKIEVYFDGRLKGKLTGRDVNLGPSSNRVPQLKIGLYGDLSTGMIDVDDVVVKETGGDEPEPTVEPSIAPEAPKQLRMVAG